MLFYYFIYWRKIDSRGKRYLVFGGKRSRSYSLKFSRTIYYYRVLPRYHRNRIHSEFFSHVFLSLFPS